MLSLTISVWTNDFHALVSELDLEVDWVGMDREMEGLVWNSRDQSLDRDKAAVDRWLGMVRIGKRIYEELGIRYLGGPFF